MHTPSRFRAAAAFLVLLSAGAPLAAQSSARRSAARVGVTAIEPPPPVAREFRAAWVATVSDIDWPSKPGLSTWEAQQELLAILNRAVALHLNAIVFQVRPGTDALYDSKLEPWSEYLTGRMGRAPEPAWDPLAFAVAEAHKRGLELHAWFNPYRARYAHPISETARTHVSRTHPSLVKKYGSFLWMDPGNPEVRRLAERVILDVVKRYDIDGVHIDDYFYPYPESDSERKPIQFPDADSYARYRRSGGRLSKDDWRRHNVDQLVHELYTGIHRTKPWVQFGISPIAGWRPNNPPGMKVFDAYQEIYADTRKWLRDGWCDYFVPQLYQTIDAPAPYPVMLDWWTAQNIRHRHLYAGNAVYKVGAHNGAAGATGALGAGVSRTTGWPSDEIISQVEITRRTRGASGNVFFSMKSLMTDVDSVDEKLATLYAEPALPPATTWLRVPPPLAPKIARGSEEATGEPVVRLSPARGQKQPWLWVVQSDQGGTWTTEIIPGYERVHHLPADGVDAIAVRAINRAGVESKPTIVTLGDVEVAADSTS